LLNGSRRKPKAKTEKQLIINSECNTLNDKIDQVAVMLNFLSLFTKAARLSTELQETTFDRSKANTTTDSANIILCD
jgi:3-phenylpropionate/cinnamic acid dioxygenase small subunit